MPGESDLFSRFGRNVDAGKIVFQEGEEGDQMFIIQDGSVKISRHIGGKEQILAILGKGDFFGEMALVDDSPRSATAMAEEDGTQLLVLDKSKFTYLLRHQPDFALVVMGKLCRQLREANKALTTGG